MGVGLGATATTTEIVSPRASIDPESGSCDVTRPGGCSSVSSSVNRTLKPADFASASARSRFTPTRFGTVDSPVAYVSVTFADKATVEPSLGLTDSTWPALASFGSEEAAFASTESKPASFSRSSAALRSLPTRPSGMVPVSGPLLTVMVTELLTSTCVSGIGSCWVTWPLVSAGPFTSRTVALRPTPSRRACAWSVV